MKKRYVILLVVFLSSISFSVQLLTGQEKTKEQKENELKLQQAIDEQKKALLEQQKAFDLQKQAVQKALQDSLLNLSRNPGTMNFSRRGRSNGTPGGMNQGFNVSPSADMQGFGRPFGNEGDAERTTWDFSKQVKESTFSRQYTFDVEKSSGTVTMSVMGDCKTGEIRVKLLMPGGKTFSDIVIDESGNLNWRKSFNISEAENKDKTGEWIFKIEAVKATGFFRISLQTY